jgi:hypothetical protein
LKDEKEPLIGFGKGNLKQRLGNELLLLASIFDDSKEREKRKNLLAQKETFSVSWFF